MGVGVEMKRAGSVQFRWGEKQEEKKKKNKTEQRR